MRIVSGMQQGKLLVRVLDGGGATTGGLAEFTPESTVSTSDLGQSCWSSWP